MDVVHSYSGVRPLYDDGEAELSRVTRDYVLKRGATRGPQVLSIFGGKITTYRRLAERVLESLAPSAATDEYSVDASRAFAGKQLRQFWDLVSRLRSRWPFLPPALATRLAQSHGTRAEFLLGDSHHWQDMGADLGGGVTTREIDFLVRHEWATTAEDILWRRSKLALHVPAESIEAIRRYLHMRPRSPYIAA